MKKAVCLLWGMLLGTFLPSVTLAAGLPPTLPAALSMHGQAIQDRLRQVAAVAPQLPAIYTGPAHARREIVVFFDPNCPFCARLWDALQPWRAQLRVEWIPIAFLRPSSIRIAATMLTAPHPAQALAENEEHYQYQTRSGGLLPALTQPAPLLQKIGRSTAIWQENFDVSPTILYQGPHKLHDVLGLPSTKQLHELLGKP